MSVHLLNSRVEYVKISYNFPAGHANALRISAIPISLYTDKIIDFLSFPPLAIVCFFYTQSNLPLAKNVYLLWNIYPSAFPLRKITPKILDPVLWDTPNTVGICSPCRLWMRASVNTCVSVFVCFLQFFSYLFNHFPLSQSMYFFHSVANSFRLLINRCNCVLT